MRVAFALGLLPGLAIASLVFNVTEVTAENAKSLGFAISVVTSSTSPRTHARITYPSEVDGVWAVVSVDVFYFEHNHQKRFVQQIDLGEEGNQPVSFLFDKQDGQSDVNALFTYSCIYEDVRCSGWDYRQFHISSIGEFEDRNKQRSTR